MTASNFTLLNVAKAKILNGTIHLNTDAFSVALLSNAFAANAAYVGASGGAHYSDLTAVEAVGTGYVAGGASLGSPTLTTSGSGVNFTGNSVAWANSTVSGMYVAVYSATAANKDILGYMQLDSQVDSSTNGTFAVSWNAQGIFSLS